MHVINSSLQKPYWFVLLLVTLVYALMIRHTVAIDAHLLLCFKYVHKNINLYIAGFATLVTLYRTSLVHNAGCVLYLTWYDMTYVIMSVYSLLFITS